MSRLIFLKPRHRRLYETTFVIHIAGNAGPDARDRAEQILEWVAEVDLRAEYSLNDAEHLRVWDGPDRLLWLFPTGDLYVDTHRLHRAARPSQRPAKRRTHRFCNGGPSSSTRFDLAQCSHTDMSAILAALEPDR